MRFEVIKNVLRFSLQDYASKRAKYGETAVKPINDILSTLAANDILSLQPFYHHGCYSNLCNSTKLKRAQSRYENALESKKAAIIAEDWSTIKYTQHCDICLLCFLFCQFFVFFSLGYYAMN